MKLIEIATRRRVAIAMAAVTLVLFGLIGLKNLKVNLLPDLAYPTLTVRLRSGLGHHGLGCSRRAPE